VTGLPVSDPEPRVAALPTVGIVVPNYNGARFLRGCLDSILAQDYPYLDCLVMDGASTDESLAVLAAYAGKIRVVSQPDRGQADAIDKGFRALQAELVGWLNSDDELLPGTVSKVAKLALENPDAVLFHGDVDRIDSFGHVVGKSRSRDTDYERHRSGVGRTVQPGSFYRRVAVEACGGVDPSFHLLMDVDLWIRLLRRGRAVRIPDTLGRFRVHEAAKSSSVPVVRYYRETMRLGFRHEQDRIVRAVFRRGAYIAMTHAGILLKSGRDQLSRLPARSRAK
jgi:glycosyltransferase involved in cell wall biosynthesis